MPINKDLQSLIPNRPGPASQYDPKMCEIAIETARQGGFHAAICLNCGISESTFAKYRREYPEFKEAIEFADLLILARQEKLLDDAAHGLVKGYEFKANALILTNKYRHLYNKEENESGNTINITNNTINMSSEEIQKKIEQKLKSIRKLGLDLIPEELPISNEQREE